MQQHAARSVESSKRDGGWISTSSISVLGTINGLRIRAFSIAQLGRSLQPLEARGFPDQLCGCLTEAPLELYGAVSRSRESSNINILPSSTNHRHQKCTVMTIYCGLSRSDRTIRVRLNCQHPCFTARVGHNHLDGGAPGVITQLDLQSAIRAISQAAAELPHKPIRPVDPKVITSLVTLHEPLIREALSRFNSVATRNRLEMQTVVCMEDRAHLPFIPRRSDSTTQGSSGKGASFGVTKSSAEVRSPQTARCHGLIAGTVIPKRLSRNCPTDV